MPEVLYSTKCVKYTTLPRATTQNTTTTHNNQHDPPPLYPSVALALSLHGNINYGPKSWCSCSLWAHTRLKLSVKLLPLLVPSFGLPKRNPSKNRERGGAMALGGRLLMMAYNNQPKVRDHGGGMFGRERDLDGTCGGDAVPSSGVLN